MRGMESRTAEEARVRLGEVLGIAQYGKEPVEITRRGKRVALVVGADWAVFPPDSEWLRKAIEAVGAPPAEADDADSDG